MVKKRVKKKGERKREGKHWDGGEKGGVGETKVKRRGGERILGVGDGWVLRRRMSKNRSCILFY